MAPLRFAFVFPTILPVNLKRGFSNLSAFLGSTLKYRLSAANLSCFLEGASIISLIFFEASPVGSGAAKLHIDSFASPL